MKRVFQVLILLIVFSFTMVHAAYAYVWTVDGKSLSKGGDAVLEGTARWIESEEYSGGILVLDNYHGGSIQIECKGTGMNQEFAVELIGNSTINSDKIGVLTTDKVEFIGNGTLTITAPIAFSTTSDVDVSDVNSVVTIYGKEIITKEEEEESEEEKNVIEESKSSSNVSSTMNRTTYLVIIGLFVIALFAVAIVVRMITKKRR